MQSSHSRPDPAAAVAGLREQALTVPSRQLHLDPAPGRMQVWGVIMEIGFPEATVTLVALADGTTSLYFSNGGGIIGVGQHQVVRSASDRLIATTDAHVAEFRPTSTHPLPATGRVRFYVRTFSGLKTAEADEQELANEGHPLSPIFLAAHGVITAIREGNPM